MFSLLRPVIFWATMVGLGTFLFRQNREQAAAGRPHFIVSQGGGEFRPTGDEANEGVLSVLMGSAVVDFRNAGIGSSPRKLDAMVMMGSSQVIVPEDWTVRLDIRPMMGSARDARPKNADRQGPADLVITGRVLMGGLEVRSQMSQAGRAQAPSEQREAA